MIAQESDINIARKAQKKHINEIANLLQIPLEKQYPYGQHIAKIDLDYIETLIREKFLFSKKGEKIYIIKQNEN